MNKTVSIILSGGFLAATIATTFYTSNLKDDLIKQLTNEEIMKYKEIVMERRNIYLMGLGLGIVLSIIYLLLIKKKIKIKSKSNIILNILACISITMLVNYFFYILYPKKQYMLQYLDKKNENIAWLKIYRTMQFRYHLAFLLGTIASGLLCYTIL